MSKMPWIALLMVCATCAPADAAEPASPSIREVAFGAGYLQMIFSEPMLTWLGPAAPPGIEITPPLRCDWSWTSDTQLSCYDQHMDSILPATRYRVAVSGGLWSQQGKEIVREERFFETQRPSVLEWGAVIDHWDNGTPVIDVRISSPVTQSALAAVLSLTEDAREVRYSLMPAPDSKTDSISGENSQWRIGYRPTDSVPRTLSLRIKPGLRTTLGPLPGVQNEVLLRARVNEPFGLRIIGCGGGNHEGQSLTKGVIESYRPHAVAATAALDQELTIECPPGELISLAFSHALSSAAIESIRSQLPKGMRHEGTFIGSFNRVSSGNLDELVRPSTIIGLLSDQADSNADLDLPDSLTSAEGARIGRSYRVHIRSTDFLPNLELGATRWLALPGSPPPPIISLTNMPRISVEQLELAGKDISSRVGSVAAGARNITVRTEGSTADPELTRHGGLIETVLKPQAELHLSRNAYAIAYAAFNVTASRAGNQTLVWVTDWQGAAPVANAKVELLRQTGPDPMRPRAELIWRKDSKPVSVLASARTGADGVALIDLPTDAEAGTRGFSLVRVTRGGQRSVIPLSGDLVGESSGRDKAVPDPLGNHQVLDWGVTDRPLYRAGETVRYRLWLRTRDQQHFRLSASAHAIKARLHLQSDGSAISESTAETDSFGSVAGTLTLPDSIRDDDYCISIDAVTRSGAHGACFRVTSFHVNAMWANLETDRPLVRDGDTITLDAEAGYFSGAAAPGAKTQFQSLLTPLRLEETYPEYASFTFLDPFENTAGNDGASLVETLGGAQFTDADGHARRSFALQVPGVVEPTNAGDLKPIPFGKIDFTVSMSVLAGSSVTAPAELKFSRYPRFVGIKINPWILRTDEDPLIEAVLISDSGQPIPEATVDIDIEEFEHKSGVKEQAQAVGHCSVTVGKPTRCPFRPKATGMYRFRASSPGAAPASIQRYALVGDQREIAEAETSASLTAGNNQPAIGTPAELVIQQPFAHAVALITVARFGVLKYWVERIDGPVKRISVPTDRNWLPGVTITAVILDAHGAAFGPHAVSGDLVKMASVDLHPAGGSGPIPLEVSLDRTQARPGERIRIRLHNPRSDIAQVTLSVVDDALRAYAPDFTARANPASHAWLGKLGDWENPRWNGLGNWERRLGARWRSTEPVFHYDIQFDTGERLDTMVVTGSSPTAAELFHWSEKTDHSTGTPAYAFPSGSGLRRHFQESPFWQTDIVLGPGSDRSIDVELPDNLTRWRVLAWAADEADGFALSEATIEASLPIEVRSDVPTRLFPGDHATIRASVRAHGSDQKIDAQLDANGAGMNASAHWNEEVRANAQRSISLLAEPSTTGDIVVDARAHGVQATDGVGATIEVASALMHEMMPVAGWLPEHGVHLKLPALPAGATRPKISVEVGRGLGALSRNWADGLRDNPHRGWEQMLSRAIGAAAAIRLEFSDTRWPDAKRTVEEALGNAGQFQDQNGEFHFFIGANGAQVGSPSMLLTAYTVQGFAFLEALGYTVPAQIKQRASSALVQSLFAKLSSSSLTSTTSQNEEVVAAAAEIGTDQIVPDAMLDVLWKARGLLSWYGRSNLARALDGRPAYEEQTRQLVDELRLAGTQLGMTRVIHDRTDSAWPFQSNTLDQCGVINAMRKLDHAENALRVRNDYLRGLADLYAGGAPILDTQASAQCLMALVDVQPGSSEVDPPLSITLSAGKNSSRLDLLPGQATTPWSRDIGTVPPYLDLRATTPDDSLLSFVAKLEYDIDGRRATDAAVGFSLERRYSVIRNHAWMDVPDARIREGDWVRVTLRLKTSQLRHFVAISDNVPGGLRPTDLELSGVADIDVIRLAGASNAWFPAHRVDDRHARFYSEQMPPGTHEIHYYARATHAGRYAALPAIAELMYGSATVSRTSSANIEIGAADDSVSSTRTN